MRTWLTGCMGVLAMQLLLGCGGPQDDGDLTLSWPEQDTAEFRELRRTLRDDPSFQRVRDAFNENYALPTNLTLRHEACGEVNAFYRPSDNSIRMCYEMYQHVEEVMTAAAGPEDDLETLIFGTWWFIALHELGHAVVDLYDLPVLGKEEDAVDEFASLTLIGLDETDLALAAGVFWHASDSGSYNAFQYADSHSLNPQRFATILCMVHGSDPAATPQLAELFSGRSCEYEYDQKRQTWEQLLQEWHQ